eukprot:Skav225589  [mRNA]  locus=scaffold901:127370:130261:+ [translate_table: standard]
MARQPRQPRIDYEPTANWYNWTYRCLPAAAKMPADRLGSLEILKWGTQHDPDATYIKRWIPALSSLPSTVAREPWRLGLHGDGEGGEGGERRELPTSGQFSDPDAAAALLLSKAEGSAAKEDAQMDSDTWTLEGSPLIHIGQVTTNGC